MQNQSNSLNTFDTELKTALYDTQTKNRFVFTS